MRSLSRQHAGDRRPCLWTRGGLAALALLLADGGDALAHGGASTRDVWTLWDVHPAVILSLLVGGCLYGLGVFRLWRRAGIGRGVRRWQALAFAGGLAVLAVALVSPLAGLSEQLFAAHMVQHLLLLLAAPPLLLLGEPRVAVALALPQAWRRPLATAMHRVTGPSMRRSLTALSLIWLVQMAALWGWHHPVLYEAALHNELLHILEHVSFVASALLFWEIAVRPFLAAGAGYWVAILFVIATALPNGLLGALMTLAPAPWYSTYAERSAAWGLTPLEDQQIAGLLMWIPPGLVYVGVVAALVLVWLERHDRGAARFAERAAAGEASP